MGVELAWTLSWRVRYSASGYDQSLEKLSEERKEFNERWDKVQSDRAKYDLDVKAHEVRCFEGSL